MKAPAPGRSTGTLTLSVGLVNIPVAVYGGTQETGVKRSRFSAAGNPVGMRNYDKETGELVPFEELSLRYETDEGVLVELSDEEIAAAVDATNGVAEVVAVVDEEQARREYVTESLLQIRPSNGSAKKKNPVAQKAFALLMGALEKDHLALVVRYCLRGKPRVGVVTSDGFLRVVYFDDEIREAAPMPTVESAGVTEDELELAGALLKAYYVEEAPAIEDEASAKIRAYAETKAAAGEVPEAPEKQAVPVTDLMAALSASLDMAKAS